MVYRFGGVEKYYRISDIHAGKVFIVYDEDNNTIAEGPYFEDRHNLPTGSEYHTIASSQPCTQ